MNDLAHAVHVVETDETLAGQLAHKRKRHSLVVVALDDLEEVHTEDLEHHHKVFSVRPVMNERVQKLDTVRGVTTHSVSFKTIPELGVIVVVAFN
jgi:hypothetical protein